MRFAIAFALAFLVSLNLSAQKNKRPNYKLLWKVSGNGLTKPSYLFGTMHAQDKRAFDLNDSVISKIIQSEAFAMEIHPDSITSFMAAVLLDEAKEQKIEKQMTPKEFKHYDSLLQKKTGLSLKKFKTVKQAKYFLEQRSMKNDKSTFLDAWLYNVARENNKVMTGLEDVSVQMKLLLENDSTELNDFKEFLNSADDGTAMDDAMGTLFTLYYDGDVEAIFNFAKANTPEDEFKEMIIDRNRNMVDNFVNEIHQHSLFAAVGAAHLGGEPGIVNLLKQKGYTVTPVSAGFSGTASKYKSKRSTAEWYTFTSGEGGYSIEMPQKPMPFEPAGLPLKFQMYLDIGTLSIYMAAHIPLGSIVENQAATKMLDKMVANMQAGQKITNVKKITMDGYEGRELETQADGYTFKVKLTIHRTNAYMLMVGPSKEGANSVDGKRFMSSLKITTPTVVEGVENVVSKEGAFTVSMPGKVSKQITDPVDPSANKPFSINILYSTDNATGAGYVVRYNDFPVGYVSVNDSTYIHSTLQSIYKSMQGIDLTTKKVDFNGYPSTHFSLLSSDRTARVEGVVTLRGERFYMLMSTGTNNGDTERSSKAFFDSFRFTPFENPILKEFAFPEGFSIKIPYAVQSDSSLTDLKDGSKRYSFVDHLSGKMFLVITESFKKYNQVESLDKFFASLKKQYLPEKKFVFEKDSSIVDKLPTHDYLFQPVNDNSMIRIRTVLAGNTAVSLWAYLPSNEDQTVSDQVFNSLKITAKSDWSLLTDKLDLILKDISSSDSTERAQAKVALGKYNFKKEHLPKVYQALRKTYPDDDKWLGVRGILLGELKKTFDNSTQKFIEELYPTLNDTTELVDRALGVLTSMKTKESVRKAIDLIMNSKSSHEFGAYSITHPLEDSLVLLNDVIADLVNSRDKFRQKGTLYSVVKMAIDSNAFTPERKNEMISMLTEIASKLADMQPNEGDYSLSLERSYMIDFLGAVPFTPQIEGILIKFEKDKDVDTKFSCIQLLLKNNVTIATDDINRVAADPSYRFKLYEELLKYNKQKLIDKKYTTEKMLAEGDLYLSLEEQDEYPEKLKFLKEKYVIDNGVKKKIFIYSYGYEDSDETYGAVAGPFDLKAKEFTRGRITGALWSEYKSDKELNKKLEKYLANYKLKLD